MTRRKKNVRAYIGIGSNTGDSRGNIDRAIALVGLVDGVAVKGVSSIYETEPVGGPRQANFLNGVFEIETTLGPLELLAELQKVERRLGRKRGIKNGPRTIDLDILLYEEETISGEKLEIPHPRMHKREFVLKGLRELGPSEKQ